MHVCDLLLLPVLYLLLFSCYVIVLIAIIMLCCYYLSLQPFFCRYFYSLSNCHFICIAVELQYICVCNALIETVLLIVKKLLQYTVDDIVFRDDK